MKFYTKLIDKALKIAYDAHHNQNDKWGIPYNIYHPAYLASQMNTEDEIITALLHDVIEDTSVTLADLEAEGFPQTVLDALKLLTHNDGSEYMDYVCHIKTNELAAKVKLADLRHNSDPTRNANLAPKDAERFRKKYGEAIHQLGKNNKMKDGILFYDRDQERYDIRFDDEEFYGGLHCGDCFDICYKGEWLETRLEYGEDWYLVGLGENVKIDGLKVRM